MTVQEVLGEGLGEEVFHRLDEYLVGRARLKFSRTQISWARGRGFAFLWTPRRWQGPTAAPVVLTLAFTAIYPSPRWKEVYEVRPGLWNHHLEIEDLEVVDAEVLRWLDRAWAEAE